MDGFRLTGKRERVIMRIMNWEQMKNSPATRGFMTVAKGVIGVTGRSLETTFKPAFMIHVQNPKDNELCYMILFQSVRLGAALLYIGLASEVVLSEWNGQLNPQNVIFTLGVAFLGAGLVDMAGLGLQAIGENRK